MYLGNSLLNFKVDERSIFPEESVRFSRNDVIETSQYKISKLLSRFQIHHTNVYYHAKFQSQGWLNTDFMKGGGVESTPYTCQIFKTPYHIGLNS